MLSLAATLGGGDGAYNAPPLPPFSIPCAPDTVHHPPGSSDGHHATQNSAVCWTGPFSRSAGLARGDATCSSSFGESLGPADSDIEVESVRKDTCQNEGDAAESPLNAHSRLSKEKQLNPEWREYRRGMEWRCRWMELRMQELGLQARRYEALLRKMRARSRTQLVQEYKSSTRSALAAPSAAGLGSVSMTPAAAYMGPLSSSSGVEPVAAADVSGEGGCARARAYPESAVLASLQVIPAMKGLVGTVPDQTTEASQAANVPGSITGVPADSQAGTSARLGGDASGSMLRPTFGGGGGEAVGPSLGYLLGGTGPSLMGLAYRKRMCRRRPHAEAVKNVDQGEVEAHMLLHPVFSRYERKLKEARDVAALNNRGGLPSSKAHASTAEGRGGSGSPRFPPASVASKQRHGHPFASDFLLWRVHQLQARLRTVQETLAFSFKTKGAAPEGPSVAGKATPPSGSEARECLDGTVSKKRPLADSSPGKVQVQAPKRKQQPPAPRPKLLMSSAVQPKPVKLPGRGANEALGEGSGGEQGFQGRGPSTPRPGQQPVALDQAFELQKPSTLAFSAKSKEAAL